MKNIAIFASGNGSNAENIVHHFYRNNSFKIALILTNKEDAYVVERAKKYSIPYEIFNLNQLKQEGYIISVLHKYDIDFIVLSGFMLKIPHELVRAFPNKIINIHPALLPKYGGKGMYGEFVHQAVFEAKETQSGITIHYVNEYYDEGAIIFQAKCDIGSNDNPETIAQKVHILEYRYFPEVIEKTVRKTFNL
ncbi:MAG: phosphoribosylglycinamide formyltransferase [Bacteroidota bacterium]